MSLKSFFIKKRFQHMTQNLKCVLQILYDSNYCAKENGLKINTERSSKDIRHYYISIELIHFETNYHIQLQQHSVLET